MKRQILWSVFDRLSSEAAGYSVTIILTILLSPEDFGQVALVSSWIGFLNIFSEMGFTSALIQREQINEKHLSSTFLINIVAGLVLTFIGVALATPLSNLFNQPTIGPLFAVASIGFVINSLSLTQTAIAYREDKIKQIAYRNFASTILSGAVGIICAFKGLGAWSLVIQTLTNYIVGTIGLWWITQWRPNFSHVDRKSISDLWGFSSKMFLFSAFKYFAQNTDKLIVGYFLGTHILGIYNFAFKIVVYPTTTLTNAAGKYLFARFSKIQSQKNQLKTEFLKVMKVTSWVAVVCLSVLALNSSLIITSIFGEKWVEAIPMIQIFCIAAFFQAQYSHFGFIMKSLGRADLMLYWGIISSVLMAGAIAIGQLFAAHGIAIAVVICNVVSLFFYFPVLKKITHISTANIFKTSVLPIIPATALYAIGNSVTQSNQARILITLFFILMAISVFFYTTRAKADSSPL